MTAPAPEREFAFTSGDFDYLRKVASDLTGIVLRDDKFNMVYARLARRVRQLELDSFASYCHYLETHQSSEVGELISAITTNLTSFFREPHHFSYLREELLPLLLRRNRDTRRLRLWSAGCSTGEEPYSIAITLAESIPDLARWDVQIVATDIDARVLQLAASGRFEQRALDALTPGQRARWFRAEPHEAAGEVCVRQDLRELVTFQRINLLGAWQLHGPFDAVFCRNVIIYFDAETKRRVVERFADYMHDDSRLFLGHSESLFRVTARFDSLGGTTYARAR